MLKFKSPDERKGALPCLFLEDLWVGYRLDLRSAGTKTFSSTHRREERITFLQSKHSISGLTEEFIDREQPDDTERGYSSSELTTYRGMSAGQSADFLEILGKPRP